VTFVEYALEWIEHYNGRTSRGIRDATKADYRARLQEAIAFFGRMQLAAIEPGDVKRYAHHVAGRGLAPNTVRLVLAPVKALFATALEDGLIRSNPTAGVRLALSIGDVEEKVKALTEEELERLLAEIPAQWRLFFDLLAATGLRIGEAVALRWCDVDFDRRRVQVLRRYYRGGFAPPKSKYGRRDVPLSAGLARDLEARWLLEEDVEGLVFPSATGTVLEHSNLMRRVLKPAARRAGVPWAGFHTFRHTCATLLFHRGVNAKQAQVWLGHHSPAFTLTVYTHLLSGDLPEVDVLDGLGGNGVATRPTEISRKTEAVETAQTGMVPRQGSLDLVP
jgi:integrase